MKFNPIKALVVLSGGQDSTTCLYWAMREFDGRVHALTFDYGQRHKAEVNCAMKIMDNLHKNNPGLHLNHEIVYLGDGILKGTSPLVNQHEQVEMYADAQSLPGGIEKTFVPMRNTLFLTVAANRAVVAGCDVIVTGVSQEDYGGYPDCRREFIELFENTINSSLDGVARLEIEAPLLYKTKKETVELAMELPGCMDALAYSHTCYKGENPPCGVCHACLLRAKGFAEAGVIDPLLR